jgi:hypothetical protein
MPDWWFVFETSDERSDEMILQQTNQRRVEYADIFNLHACPECGMKMTEVERVKEGGFLFIWYECNLENCNGQWLEKKKAAPQKYPS